MPNPFTTTRRVEFRDTDTAGIAHFSVFFTFMEEAEHEFLRHLGLSVHTHQGDDVISWPRVSAQCDFSGSLRFEDVVNIAVEIERIGEKSVTYTFAFSRDGDEIAAGRMTSVCCRLVPGQPPEPLKIPKSIRGKLEAERGRLGEGEIGSEGDGESGTASPV